MTDGRFSPVLSNPFSACFSLLCIASVDIHVFCLLTYDLSAPQTVISVRAGIACFACCRVPDARHGGWHTAGAWYKWSAPHVFSCPSPPSGLPDRPRHQRQRELLPHVQEDVPTQARPNGHQPRSPPRPRGLSPPVLTPLPQRIAAHVSFGTFLQG